MKLRRTPGFERTGIYTRESRRQRLAAKFAQTDGAETLRRLRAIAGDRQVTASARLLTATEALSESLQSRGMRVVIATIAVTGSWYLLHH